MTCGLESLRKEQPNYAAGCAHVCLWAAPHAPVNFIWDLEALRVECTAKHRLANHASWRKTNEHARDWTEADVSGATGTTICLRKNRVWCAAAAFSARKKGHPGATVEESQPRSANLQSQLDDMDAYNSSNG